MLNRPKLLRFGRAASHAPDRLVCADNAVLLGSSDLAAAEAFDVIYVDPPFGTGTVRRGSPAAGTPTYRDVPDDPDRFVTWLRPRLVAMREALADHGSLFVHLDYRSVHYVKVELDRLFGRSRFVNEIVWCYSVGGKSRRTFGRKHDTILWYARGRDYAFYPDAVRVPRKGGSHMRVVRDEDGQLVQEKTDRKTGKVYRYPVAAGKIPEDWWTDIETLNRGDAERTGWPTQKPQRLLKRIVAATTRPGDLVADFFCGSGTTCAVAQELDRRFLGADAAAEAIACAAERLERAGRALAAAGTPPRDVEVYSGTPQSSPSPPEPSSPEPSSPESPPP